MKREYIGIAEVAKLFQIPASTLRYYDKQKLISVRKNDENGYRIYEAEDLENIKRILFLRKLGFSIEQIRDTYYSAERETWNRLLKENLLLQKSRLEELKGLIENVEQELNMINKAAQGPEFLHLSETHYKKIGVMKEDAFNLKYMNEEYFEVFSNFDHNSGFTLLYKDIGDPIDGQEIDVFIKNEQANDLITPAGLYYHCYLEYEHKKIEPQLMKELCWLKENRYKIKGFLIINSYPSHLMLFRSNVYFEECLIPVATK